MIITPTLMTMKNTCTLLLYLIAMSSAFAQLYTDASANLPDDGAKGASMDVRAVDVDNDGDLDIVLANEFQPNTLLVNDGAGVFTKADADALPQEVHDSEDIAIADFNGDGHVDLIFCSEDDIHQGWTNVHEYYLGDGTGKFTDAPYHFPDSEANAVTTFDVNKDGSPDVLFGNKGFNRIYINNGDGTFELAEDRLPLINRTTQDLAFADIDGDSDLDLFAGNENGNVLYLNNGTGTYSDISATHLPQGVNMETRKASFGDVDNDGDVDLFLSNVMFIQGKVIRNRLYLNDGNGLFTDVSMAQIPNDNDHTIDAIFEDMDLDGDLDIFVSNVFGARLKVYVNDGSGTFTDGTNDILAMSYVRDALGVFAADLNGDGARDFYICDRFAPAQNRKDLLLLREPVTSINQSASASAGVRIYPSQITDLFYVETKLTDITTILLENVQGQVIDSLSLELQEEGLYFGSVEHLSLPTGMYIMHLPRTGTKAMVMIRS